LTASCAEVGRCDEVSPESRAIARSRAAAKELGPRNEVRKGNSWRRGVAVVTMFKSLSKAKYSTRGGRSGMFGRRGKNAESQGMACPDKSRSA
jgi:hypothetical protein